jgi:hypothetical protein
MSFCYSIPMAATGFLVFYRFKAMTREETERAKNQWNGLKDTLPSGIELVGEYVSAWGTEYNGFLLLEAETADSFLDWWSKFKDTIRWYVEETHTIVARRT